MMDEIMCDVPGLAAAIWEEREREEFEAWFSDECQHCNGAGRILHQAGTELEHTIRCHVCDPEPEHGTPAAVADRIAALNAEIARKDEALAKAASQISDLAYQLGKAQGKLEASEWPGIADGWRGRRQ